MFNKYKDKKDKAMKQSEFKQKVLMAIDKINIKIDEMDIEFKNFKNYVIEKFDKQEKFNESILQAIKVLKKFHENEL